MMCETCWEKYGSPTIFSAKVLDAVRLIEKVDGLTANLHCQLDDWNLEDEYWTEYYNRMPYFSQQQIEAEKECFEFMKSLSLSERASALGLYDGYWKPKGE
jgi:hypothetical protein